MLLEKNLNKVCKQCTYHCDLNARICEVCDNNFYNSQNVSANYYIKQKTFEKIEPGEQISQNFRIKSNEIKCKV
jgi:hypothetical protein